jgi:hypothetical protein
LPAVLYGCETWSLTLGEKCRLRVFEDTRQRTIFGPKIDDVVGEWRKLTAGSFMLCISQQISYGDQDRQAGHVAQMKERRGAYRVLVGEREGRRPLGRHRRRWQDNIKMYLREVGWGHGQDRSGELC